MSVFTPEEREALRADLVAAARADERVVASAHIGSRAAGRLDRWSDIDLGLALAPAHRDEVVAAWTDRMYRAGAVAHLDVRRGTTLYRVFLLSNTLQVDLSFWDAAEFGATGPAFEQIFGTANAKPRQETDPFEVAGLAWVYALHVRSSIARGRPWQAEFMLGEVRDRVLALACLRRGLPESEGRGWDDLPREVTSLLEAALVHSLDLAELRRAFAVTVTALLGELRHVDGEFADRLAGPLTALLD